MSQTALQEQSREAPEIETLKTNVYDLQHQLQVAYARIGELVDERDKLRCDMISKIKR